MVLVTLNSEVREWLGQSQEFLMVDSGLGMRRRVGEEWCVGVIGPLNSDIRELLCWSQELLMELG